MSLLVVRFVAVVVWCVVMVTLSSSGHGPVVVETILTTFVLGVEGREPLGTQGWGPALTTELALLCTRELAAALPAAWTRGKRRSRDDVAWPTGA